MGQAAWGDADGPDFFRVVGTHGYTLNMRANGDENAKLVGAKPADATGLRNMGCKGRLSFAEYQATTPERRRAARFSRWCLIEYNGTVGWVAGWHLAEAPGRVRPSFDCAKAKSGAEKLVCKDAALAILDNELARLFRRAESGPAMTDERRNHLKAFQRGWIEGREDCWKAGDKIYDCVFDEYAMRIHEISSENADARGADAGGISLGPFAYRCEGMGDVVSALFVRGRAALVFLHWGREWHTLRQAVAASGARYEKAGDDMQFWIRGAEARFTRPGARETTCRTGPAG